MAASATAGGAEDAAALAPWTHRGPLALARFAFDLQRDPVRAFAALAARGEPTFVFERPRGRARAPARPVVVSTDPALLRLVLHDPRFRNSSLTLSGPRGSAHRRLRHSIFRMHGEEHRRHRRLVMPAMQPRAVEPLCDAMVDGALRVFGRYAVGQRRDVARDAKELARGAAAASLFGIADLDEAEALGRQVEDWLADSYRVVPRLLPYDLPGSRYRAMLRKAERLERTALALLARKRESGFAGTDLLTHLARELDGSAASAGGDAGGALRASDVLGHVHIFFLAAHETTSHALAWTLFLLAQHPRALERATDEVRGVLGSARPTPDALARLRFLDAAIDESLRLFPIVPFGARIAAEDVELGGRALPRKSRILVPYCALHHDAGSFPEPRRFAPERWLEGATPPPYAYLPFGAGLHMCVGTSFAKQSMLVALACLLQRFSLRVVDGARIDRRTTVTMAPSPGVPIEILPAGTPSRRARVRGSALDLVDLR